MFGKHKDTRAANAPLADGETYKAPGQKKPVSEMVRGGRMVPVRLGKAEPK